MKVFNLIIILFVGFCATAQTSFYSIYCEEINNRSFKDASDVFHDFKLIGFDLTDVKTRLDKAKDFSYFKFHISDELEVEMVLYPYDIRSEDYYASIQGLSGKELIKPIDNCTYRGYVNNYEKSEVRMTITDDFINAQFQLNGTNYYIENFSRYSNNRADKELIFYNDKQVNSSVNATCGDTSDVHIEVVEAQEQDKRMNDCYAVRMAVAIDHLMVAHIAHPSIEDCIVQNLAVMNNVALNYELNNNFNFNDGLEFLIVSHYVSTCEKCDPWTHSTNLNQVLSDFHVWGSNDGFGVDFDIAQFWTKRNFDGNAVGLAFQASNLVCNNSAFHVLQEWTLSIPLLRATTAHEICHNLGGSHVNTSGMLMSPVVSNTNDWSTQTKSTVNNEISTYLTGCLDLCNALQAPCDPIENIQLTNITNTGFDISWNAIPSANFDIVVMDLHDEAIVYSVTTSLNTLSINPGGFSSCKTYKISILNNCGSDNNNLKEIIFESPDSQGCAAFTADKCVFWQGGTVQFIDQSVNANSWLWDFGDGNSSTLQNPTHAYAGAGFYTVSLFVNGGTNIMAKSDFIKTLPERSLPYTLSDGGNFETNIQDFAADVIDGEESFFELGIASNFLSSTTNVWKTKLSSDIGNQENESVIYSPKFNLSATGMYTVEFDMGMELIFCNAPGAAQMQYSIDNGNTWVRLGSYGDTGPGIINWYDSGPISPCPISSQVFADQTGWAFIGNYEHKSYDISFLSGNSSVIFRFVYSVSSVFSGGYNIDGVLFDNFEIKAELATLPIRDLGFSSKQNENELVLYWENNGEYDLVKYALERSGDQKEFKEIYQTMAHNDSQYNYYTYPDSEAKSGVNYYRLKLENLDRSVEYSDVISVVFKRQINNFNIFPNPTTNDYVSFSYEVGTDTPWQLLSSNGAVIQYGIFKSGNIGIEEISLEAYADGIYFLKILLPDGESITKKLLKI